MIIVSIISLIVLTDGAVQVSPFSRTLYTPVNMYRSTYSATLTGASNTFSVNYPASPWKATPDVLYSITGLAFSHHLNFQLNITSKTLTALTAQITYDSTLKSVSFCFLIMDSSLYSTSISFFNYAIPPGTTTPQQFLITNNDQHAASFLVGLKLTQGPFPSGYAPGVDSFVVLAQSNIITTNLTITYDPLQISVQKMSMMFADFNLNRFRPPDYAGSGQQFAIFGTSGIANDPFMASTYLSSYSRNYFFGIMVFFNGQFLTGSISIDAVNSLTTNGEYFNSELLFVSYHCPSNYPITDSNRQFCYSDCQMGYYWDGQYMCQPCDANCLTCSMNATNCTSCQSPWVLSYGYVCRCSDDSYQVNSTNGTISCVLCSIAISGCYSCQNDSVCLSCMNNMELTGVTICLCPLTTTSVTINSQTYCVDSLFSYQENCTNGFVQEGQMCLCNDSYNVSLVGGICS